ncbi:ATP-binding protein [Arabiibacter massiliensis]|uniref:ATP-binding protein n=1 Tax=Arabiibacter massiliensis TaxID=1870985 RepID=UPI00155AC057|nr:AAA family ATPase [Arabiibacter massiliensis]
MLKRKIDDALLNWKHTKGKQGLLVTGARQVGKTSSIEAFARAHYQNMVKIDFVEQPEAVELIGGAADLNDLLVRITALASKPLPNGTTLLFFDEVQRCGDAITWMRYLANDGRFDVVYSGSMLGVEAYDYRSLPVGTLDIIEMFPMDFQEFCWAMGVDDTLWETIEERFHSRTAVPDFLHERFIGLFERYVLVGGMPEAVQVFSSTSDTQAMRARQRSIMDAYQADITRYVKNKEHAQRIKTIFNAIPAQLNKENRRFYVTGIDKKRRFDDLAPDFDWLANAGVAIPVTRATEAASPLGMSVDRSYFKLYLCDVGLLFSTFAAADVQAILANSDRINFGSAYENAVAQELRAHGHESLHYFNTKNVGEVDFLIEDGRSPTVLPVEVKSGKYSKKHAALDKLLDVKNYGIERACVLHRYNVAKEGPVTYLPLYMTSFL